jgi:hypothetical protein
MTEEEVDIEEKLSDVACLIKFIIILDNSGKIIYSKYFTDKNTAEKQREFEKQLCFQVKNLNILPGELDVFTIEDYNVFVKLIGEVAYFIGINENDNECLGYNFCKIFENCLANILNDNFQRMKIFNNLEKIMLLIDEMIDNGIIVNTDQDSIEKLIIHQEQGGSKFISFNTSDSGSSGGGGLFSSIFNGARSIFG